MSLIMYTSNFIFFPHAYCFYFLIITKNWHRMCSDMNANIKSLLPKTVHSVYFQTFKRCFLFLFPFKISLLMQTEKLLYIGVPLKAPSSNLSWIVLLKAGIYLLSVKHSMHSMLP